MSQQKTDNRLARRDFLSWLCKIGGGVSVITLTADLLPLKRINKTLFSSEAHAQEACTEDECTIRDACESGDAGHVCEERDICNIDESGDCRNDVCDTDQSGECVSDWCEEDSSGSCRSDTCNSDISEGCVSDTCDSDSSGDCVSDECTADASGACVSDKCTGDSSGVCTGDQCDTDASNTCKNDECTSDTSGGCKSDSCISDKSGGCESDSCISDKSGGCKSDVCEADNAGDCVADLCVSDSSGACTKDSCTQDSSAGGVNDRCNSDYSGECTLRDVCVLDASDTCESDLCREDRSPACTTSDTCALDLALNALTSRRQFARAGINKAIKLLYKLAAVVLFIGLAYGQSEAATVINAANAVFSHTPTYVTAGAVSVTSPVGPFLRDCDNDGILEADVNGDGQCTGDPEVRDYNGDGSRELPEGTTFTGDFQFTCFYIPDDVAIVATGPLSIAASREAAVFGAVRLASGVQISSLAMIDLRTSAWLCEDGSEIRFTTSLTGEIDETQTAYAEDDSVPPITFTSLCADIRKVVKAVPTLTWWGMIAFGLVAMGSAVGMLLRKRRHGPSGM